MARLQGTFGAYNLAELWRLTCLKALGLEEWLVVDREEDDRAHASTLQNTPFQVINLLTWETEQSEDLSDRAKASNKVSMDPWMETADHIQANIHDMASWIRQKQREYVSLDIADGEASLIQTTVTSFTATTANEIESLHQCVSTLNCGQKQQHCAGIVQILMTDLKERIAEPFGALSKQRNRTAVQLWQRPLQCRLWTSRRRTNTSPSSSKDSTLELLGLDDDDDDGDGTNKNVDQRFLPTRPTHRLHRDFMQLYERSKLDGSRKLPRPPFLFPLTDDGQKNVSFSVATPAPTTVATRANPKGSHDFGIWSHEEDGNDDRASIAAALQQEAVLLQAKTHSDLDSVQKMEQTMMDITALLSQFADLVSEQQEDVWEIHDATISTKENLQKGQENLIDAKERTAASKHYMATAITVMAAMLLILNWLLP
jgi:hypothetical protein